MIKIDNEKLKDLLKDRDLILTSLYDEDIDDTQYKKLEYLKTLKPLDLDIFYLCTIYGTSFTSKIYGCSMRLLQYKVKEIKDNLNKCI